MYVHLSMHLYKLPSPSRKLFMSAAIDHTDTQSNSDDLNSQLDQCYRQVNDLTTKSQRCNDMVASLKVGSVLFVSLLEPSLTICCF